LDEVVTAMRRDAVAGVACRAADTHTAIVPATSYNESSARHSSDASPQESRRRRSSCNPFGLRQR
jgi:hypothetical protein